MGWREAGKRVPKQEEKKKKKKVYHQKLFFVIADMFLMKYCRRSEGANERGSH